MASSAALATDRRPTATKPGTGVTAIGWLMALWCVGFAVVNIVFEGTGHFADARFAEYATAITVMNWLVVGLKALGAGVALLSVDHRQRLGTPAFITMLVWGTFATLGVYVLGSVGQAIGMVTGLTGTAGDVDLAGIAYVLFFSLAATGFGILAVSYSRRHDVRRHYALLGVLGAPIVLGVVLVVVPALLAALGLMPAE